MKPSGRSQVEPFRVMEVLAAANLRARSGQPVYHLEAGQPSTPAPALALEAATRALHTMTLGYTEALGVPQLRARIARHYREWYDIDVPAERIVVTTGSSAAFVLAFLLGFEAGQTLAIANPGYPAYRNIAGALNIRTRLIPCGPEAGFRLNADLVAAHQADGVLIASPSNPCGTVIGASDLEGIALHCRSRGMRLISDEIYHGLVYGTRAETALHFDPDAIVINSFSKYFSMTGWRIGWMVLPANCVETVERLAQNFYISPPTISQVAALAAMDAGEELEGHVQRYGRNRRVLLSALEKAGYDIIAPAEGAFYLYARTAHSGLGSELFSKRLLAETGVAATPGTDFDPLDGQSWIRFSYAGSEADIAAASELLIAWSRSLKQN
jgi:aspartate/methionine/tyrosine aminotransferase